MDKETSKNTLILHALNQLRGRRLLLKGCKHDRRSLQTGGSRLRTHLRHGRSKDLQKAQVTPTKKFAVVARENRKVGRERFELSTFRLSAERSSQTELPALAALDTINCQPFLRVFRNPFYWFRANLFWARSLVWIKAPAFGAGDQGFKSPRARILLLFSRILWKIKARIYC